MPIPIRETFPTDRSDLLVQLTDDGSRTLVCVDSGDGFHSGCGALSESRHVYLENSGVAQRLKSGRPTTALEVGLGTAMTMLLTVEAAARHATPLTYIALETDWISAETLMALQPHDWLSDPTIVDGYLTFREESQLSDEASTTWAWTEDIRVHVLIEDFRNWTPKRDSEFDAVFFDPFSPDSAPQLWTQQGFQKLLPALSRDGNLTTYSCSRAVRDTLEAAGYQCRRVPGPRGGKREVLIAEPRETGLN